MQVRQTVLVRREDKNRVHIRYIDAGFDDSGREQDVVVIVDEGLEPLFHLVGRQLSVCHYDAGFGTETLNPPLDTRQHLDAVVDDEHLSVAAQLLFDSVLDDIFVVDSDQFGLYGIAVLGRGSHDAQVTGTEQRELQGARDRSGSQRQDIDVGPQRFEFLFGCYAELLLLVDDEQAQVVPMHTLAYQFVRTDEYIYLAGLQVG